MLPMLPATVGGIATGGNGHGHAHGNGHDHGNGAGTALLTSGHE
jgi:hypothetical protein